MSAHHPTPARDDAPSPEPAGALLGLLRRALEGLRFGSVELVVHDGRVVHVERRERLRMDADPAAGGDRGPTTHRSGSDRSVGVPPMPFSQPADSAPVAFTRFQIAF